MRHIVVENSARLPRVLLSLLPARLLYEIAERLPEGAVPEEIRLRRDRVASLTVGGENLVLTTALTGAELDELLFRVCDGSVYAHSESLCRGFVTMSGGVRVGVCGTAGVAEGRVIGVSAVASLVFRLPAARLPDIGEPVAALLGRPRPTRGVLVYAPPGVGKTTLLRAVARRMSGGEHPVRVALIDTRGELSAGLSAPSLLLDPLIGYPRGVGLSIATRTLSAELAICDEIGDLAEAREMLEAQSAGLPLLASAHAATLGELLARPAIRLLHEARVFGAYVGISRRVGVFDFDYTVTSREEADAFL